MDAALLVLLAGYLAAALEVPLDRKTTHHTPPRACQIVQTWSSVRGGFYRRVDQLIIFVCQQTKTLIASCEDLMLFLVMYSRNSWGTKLAI